MFKNYFKIAFRNLRRNRSYVIINIAGLAIGIVSTALIFLWVEDELLFNSYFPNKERFYKIKNSQTYDGETYVFDATPGPLAAGIKSDIPGVKNAARSTWSQQLLFTIGDKNMYAPGNYVDASLLEMLHLQFVSGNAATAFSQENSIVLTEKAALKFFGNIQAAGKELRVDNKENYLVSAVVKDLPAGTSFRFEWLAPFKIIEKQSSWLKEWGSNGILTYVELQENASAGSADKKLHDYIDSKTESSYCKLSLYPMDRWRLYDSFDKNGMEVEGVSRYVRLFTIIAWVILLIACINFMNLATASSEKRSREVGVRKALGSGKKQLVIQFLSESLIMSVLSAALAILVIFLVLPAFNTLIHKDLALDVFSPRHITALTLITLLCGLIAGSYPAFYLSSFNPVATLKGSKPQLNRGAGFIRKGLVVLQFTVSITLIICTLIIYRQIQHVKTRDIGYTKEGLLHTGLQGSLGEKFNSVKNDLQKITGVKNACLSTNRVLQLGSNSGDFTWPGKDASRSILITLESVSPEYLGTVGLKLKEGRDFYPNAIADSTNVIINEALAKLIGAKTAVGMQIYRPEGTRFTIVGVIRDFVYTSMYGEAQPMILFSDPSNVNVLTIRVNADDHLRTTLSKIEQVIKVHNPGYPFEYQFVDEQFDRLFRTETLINQLAGIFASLAVFISCLGLFGLTSYITERRAKEISIRKVLGASVLVLTRLLSRDFIRLVILACVLAFPLAAYFMNSWLRDYQYHTGLSWWIFVLAGAAAILIALMTVSFRAIKTALANPIKNLRTE